MKPSELKEILRMNGISHDDCIEKQDLVARLLENIDAVFPEAGEGSPTDTAEDPGPGSAVGENDAMECSICCTENIPSTESTELVTPACKHTVRTVCRTCIQRHIREEVTGKANSTSIACPQSGCSARLRYEDVRAWAVSEVFGAYDNLLLRQTIEAQPEFRWCAHERCGSGQQHIGMHDEPIMTCGSCRKKTCFTHRCAWHEDRTCREYDEDAGKNDEVAALQSLESTDKLKRCPSCNQGIEKNDGCDHMTCKKPLGCGLPYSDCFLLSSSV
jgi:E3 ubiquitin-protein ligase RNF14